MTTYTYSKARQNFSSVLDKAKEEGEIRIKRKDGSYFLLRSISPKKSPLNVKGIKLKISADEILDILKEVRNR